MGKDDDIVMILQPSMGRRLLGAGCLAGLGVLMLTLGLDAKGIWPSVLLVLSIVVLVGAFRLWQATSDRLELTRTELRTGSGRVLTPISNVKAVDRGAFAFKPSNGFLVKLEEPCGSGWSPGLWWQRGRMIGVGGVIRGGESRAMAEFIMGVKDGTLDEVL